MTRAKVLFFCLTLALIVFPAQAWCEANQPAPDMDNLPSVLKPAPKEDLSADAQAQQIALPATFQNVFKAAIRMNAFDFNDDRVVDDFAKILHCDIYQRYRNNEFDWRRVRVALRQSVKLEIPKYPTVFYLERSEYFNKYDFTDGILHLSNESVMRHTSVLRLALHDTKGICNSSLQVVPGLYVAVLDNPIQIDGIPLSEDEARSVTEDMDLRVTDPIAASIVRLAYGRYTLSLLNLRNYNQQNGTVSFNAHLNNLTYYKDAKLQNPFWSGLSTINNTIDHRNSLEAIPFQGIDSGNGGPK